MTVPVGRLDISFLTRGSSKPLALATFCESGRLSSDDFALPRRWRSFRQGPQVSHGKPRPRRRITNRTPGGPVLDELPIYLSNLVVAQCPRL